MTYSNRNQLVLISVLALALSSCTTMADSFFHTTTYRVQLEGRSYPLRYDYVVQKRPKVGLSTDQDRVKEQNDFEFNRLIAGEVPPVEVIEVPGSFSISVREGEHILLRIYTIHNMKPIVATIYRDPFLVAKVDIEDKGLLGNQIISF